MEFLVESNHVGVISVRNYSCFRKVVGKKLWPKSAIRVSPCLLTVPGKSVYEPDTG
jgi:hypothetical protein